MEAASRAVPQHLAALDHANKVRLARAATKRRILAGKVRVADVLREVPPPWELATMGVGDLLRSQRRWGRTRSRKFLSRLSIHENRELARMTPRQRILLADELEEHARRRR